MTRVPNTLSDQAAHREAARYDVGPGWRRPIAPWSGYSRRQKVECALDFSAQYVSLELLLPYPRHFRPEAIAEELVAALEVYVVSSPELQKIPCHIVGDLELVCLIANTYEVTVYYKRDAYLHWLACQVTLQSLIEVILPTVRSRWWHQLRRGSYLE